MPGLSKTNIPSLKQIYSGKVRDCYAVGDDKLLLVATDRISAFDVIRRSDSRQGQGPYGAHELLVRKAEGRDPQPPHGHRP